LRFGSVVDSNYPGIMEVPSFSDHRFLPDFSRMAWFNFSEIFANYTFEPNNLWPLDVYCAFQNKQHQCKLYFIVKDDSVFESTLRRFLGNPALLKTLEEYTTKTAQETLSRLSGKCSALDDRQLAQLFLFYSHQSSQLHRVALTLRLLDHGALLHLKKIIPPEDIGGIAVSDRLTFSSQEELEVTRLAAKKNPQPADIRKIMAKYQWLGCGYYNEQPRDFEFYNAKITKLRGSDPKRILEERKRHRESELENRQQLEKGLPKKDQGLAKIAAESTYLKDYFKYCINHFIFCAEPIFTEIAARTKVSKELIKDLAQQEVVDLIGRQKIDWDNVKLRTAHSIYITRMGNCRILLQDKEADNFERSYLSERNPNELSGRVASRGLVRGRATIVLGPQDFSKVEEGDVIVVMNTSPDFVPLLNKVKAIVAEEGGITAHVSVISREFKIPAVVGVARATSRLRDGDWVEVDAEKGKITIMKK